MKGFLLMWALAPTDIEIMNAYAYMAFDTYEECTAFEQLIELGIDVVNDDSHVFCIGVNELNHLREEPI